MNYEEFRNEVKENIASHLPEKYEGADISINEVVKNNDNHLFGLSIRREDSNITPTIYLESFFEEFENGKPMDEILDKLAEVREEHDMAHDFDLNSILDIDKVRDNISCRLVGMENNEQFLSDRPYDKVSDLAVIYCIKVEGMDGGSIPITNRLLDEMGISHEELHNIAMDNLQKEDLSFKSMREVLLGMAGKTGIGEELIGDIGDTLDESMYVLSNKEYTNGAVAVLNTNMMDKVAEKFGGDVIVLPSSTHELIILKMMEDFDRAQLEDMVKTVNATEVRPEERLSDNVYVYDAKEHQLILAEEYEKTHVKTAEHSAEYSADSLAQDLVGSVSEAGNEYQTRERISITFAKGLVGDPFLGKDGNGYREVKIPNVDENDKRPWQSFVLRNDQIHENENGKSCWASLTKDGETTVGRSVRVGEDEQGKGIYEKQMMKMPNTELKAQIENYRNKDRDAERPAPAQSVAQEKPKYEAKDEKKKTNIRDMINKNKERSAANPSKKSPEKKKEEVLS